jgi:hypothetical protein
MKNLVRIGLLCGLLALMTHVSVINADELKAVAAEPAAVPALVVPIGIDFDFNILPGGVELEEEPDAVQAIEQVIEEALEDPLNLGILAAPLQMLFGGAINRAVGIQIMAGPMGLVAGPDAEAQNEAMTQQFIMQFRPVLLEELRFIRLVCSDLTPGQRSAIKEAGVAGLRQAAKEMAVFQNRQNEGRGGIGVLGPQPEPRSKIREVVSNVLQQTLNDEQSKVYSAEAAERTAQRKEFAILSLVSRLDGALFLNSEQREKITTDISVNWQDKWEQWLMMGSVYGDQYFPVIPDQLVAAHLNPDQKEVWQTLQKIDFGFWWGGGDQGQPIDPWWGEDPADACAPENGDPNLQMQRLGIAVGVDFNVIENATEIEE